MNAVVAPIQVHTENSLVSAAIAFHEAVAHQNSIHGTSDDLLSNAYRSVEGAISALRAEGTMLAELVQLEAMAHKFAPAYERHRLIWREAQERAQTTRHALESLGAYPARLQDAADDIGDDTAADEALADKVREVASMLDAEDHS